jgi:hypothetical protein
MENNLHYDLFKEKMWKTRKSYEEIIATMYAMHKMFEQKDMGMILWKTLREDIDGKEIINEN